MFMQNKYHKIPKLVFGTLFHLFFAKWEPILIGAIIMSMTLCSRAKTVGADPDVSRARLDNGLQVIIVRSQLAPVVTIITNYLVGSNEAPEGFPGMAHAQEHMMFRGNPGLTAGQLADIVAAMGGKFNADTQQTVTQYFFTVPAETVTICDGVVSFELNP